MRRVPFGTFLLLLGLPHAIRADILHVPDPWPSIQAALSFVSDGDTVLVEPGTYSEALQAPAVTFSLFGVVGADSNQPIVDPALVPGSTHLACLSLPLGSDVHIQDFTFRNGPEMFPRDDPSVPGGVGYGSSQLSLIRCLFDSVDVPLHRTSHGNEPQGTLTVTGCRFQDCMGVCISDGDTLSKVIRNSDFSGAVELFVLLVDSTLIEDCTFNGSQLPHAAEFVWLTGRADTIRGCRFIGPTPLGCNFVLMTQAVVCENNVFEDISAMNCVIEGGIPPDADTVRYSLNEFRRCQGQGWMSGGGIRINGNGHDPRSCTVLIDHCTFDSCTATSRTGFGAISLSGARAVLTHNVHRGHFVQVPGIRLYYSFSEIHGCSFENTGIAVQEQGRESFVNAEFNWWGDSTGPYHPAYNPQGQGDAIDGDVDFIPWIGDTAEAVTEPGIALPTEFAFSAYPNPFNPVTTLFFSLPRRQRVKVQIYDLTGREMTILADGTYEAGEHIVTFDGSALASGLYFARVRAGSSSLTRKVVLLR